MKDESQAKNVSFGVLSPISEGFRGDIARYSASGEERVGIADPICQLEIDQNWSIGCPLFFKHNRLELQAAVEY